MLFDAYPHVYGGAQRTDHLLATLLPARGWDLEVLAPMPGPLIERVAADGAPATVVAAPASLTRYGRSTTGGAAARAALDLPRWWWRLWCELRARRPDVVHIVDHRGLVLAGLPARGSGARVVWHVQAQDANRWLNRLGARLAHTVVVPTTAALRQMPDLRRAHRLEAIANVVPAHARRDMPVPLASAPVLTTTARLHPDKGLDVLADALVLVRRQVAGARVQVIGPPQEGLHAYVEELRTHVRRCGLGDAFALLGFVERPELLVGASRCYVQPARERTEILPLAILEAMATGVPVVATDVGGVRDIVRHEETGLLVAPEDPPALAAALERMLVDDALAERLRSAAFALANERRYSADGLADAFAGAYAAA